MKLSKDELKQKIVQTVTDEDVQIALLEDVEDSMDITSDNTDEINTLKVENEDLKTKYEDIKTKYKNRFLGTDSEESKEEKIDEPKEEEKVEETDIFKEIEKE